MPIHGNFDCLGIAREWMQDRFPDVAGKFSGLLVIVASGRGVWDDLERAGMAKNHDRGTAAPDVMCLNDMIAYYPGRIDHAYSNDHEQLPHWIGARRRSHTQAWENPHHVHTCHHGAKFSWPWPGHGTSGLNAVYTGLALGYSEIRICGMPLDNAGHFFDPPWEATNFGNQITVDGELPYWTNAAKNIFEDRVRSYSGRTRELLGEPG